LEGGVAEGLVGGAESQVTEATTEIVFEMATWDPVAVRTAARRLNISTDAAYRFQRGIDPGTIGSAARNTRSSLISSGAYRM